MARRQHGSHDEKSNETEAGAGGETTSTEPGGTPEFPSGDSQGAAGVANGAQASPGSVDSTTGEIGGASEEGSQPQVDLEQIALPKKIVAKEIISRAVLKCHKKFIAEKDANGDPKMDAEGSPVGTWEVSPELALYTVFGTAEKTDGGESQYGAYTEFIGNFEAVRESDGKRYRSTRLFLQQPAEGLLVSALGNAKIRDPSASVNFAFKVGRRTSQKWVDTGQGNSYEYTVDSIINVVKHDPLASMRQQLLGVLPKPAPKQITQGTPES